jgi:hypothetical protein
MAGPVPICAKLISRMPVLCNALDLSRCGAVAAEPDWGAVYPTLSAVAGGIGKGLASARILGRCFIAGAFLQNASRVAWRDCRVDASPKRCDPGLSRGCAICRRRAAEITLDKRGLARGKRRWLVFFREAGWMGRGGCASVGPPRRRFRGLHATVLARRLPPP